MSIRLSFSGQLLQYRTQHRMTQKRMAEICDLSLRQYQNLELGHSLPSFEKGIQIAALLDLSLDALKLEIAEELTPVQE